MPGLIAALPLSALVGVAGWVTGNRWEIRKLSRSERAESYVAFLDAASKRWAAFSERDRLAKKAGRDSVEVATISRESAELRDDMYEAYCSVQILGSKRAVKAGLTLVQLYDQRNAAFFDSKKKAPGSDVRAAALGEFVEAARADLRLKSIDGSLSR